MEKRRTVHDVALGIVQQLAQICPSPEQAQQALYADLVRIFGEHNKPDLGQEDIDSCKQAVEKAIADFKEKHPQRFFYYDGF